MPKHTRLYPQNLLSKNGPNKIFLSKHHMAPNNKISTDLAE